MTAEEKVDLIVQTAEDAKAERIETLDVRRKTSIADYFIVCTGNNDIHVKAISDRVTERMATAKSKPARTNSDGGWELQDYGDVVLHVMREEKRQFYDLETLWTTMQPDPNLVD